MCFHNDKKHPYLKRKKKKVKRQKQTKKCLC